MQDVTSVRRRPRDENRSIVNRFPAAQRSRHVANPIRIQTITLGVFFTMSSSGVATSKFQCCDTLDSDTLLALGVLYVATLTGWYCDILDNGHGFFTSTTINNITTLEIWCCDITALVLRHSQKSAPG
ncbi:hypothetical protein PVK06_015707 [Gossypium arboreum]|uniref:Uncharacterized protein n=1 Tax=Gossypium arboreum TaxID=29729 RepID=A0ABR0PYX3_GOSAR|nr:hypothetical protein PVK06_015707 [Gossypium arboreum]